LKKDLLLRLDTEDTSDVFVARQPIFNKKKSLYAYELLFRDGLNNMMPNIDGDTATSTLLSNSFLTLGIDALTGGKKAFINFTRKLLIQEIPFLFPRETTVIEILENIDRLPEGLLFYDNISKTRPNKPPQVSISLLSDAVMVGDTVTAWNDETRFYDDKASYHYPALPEWAGTKWDWGDGTPVTVGGPTANHVYQKPGTYIITLEFTDTEESTAKAIKEVKVLPLTINKS